MMKKFDETTIKKLNIEIDEILKREKIVGAEVALVNHKEVLYQKDFGFSNKKEEVASSVDTLYKIGANMKVFTAIGIFKLLEKNLISLDDDIRMYINEFFVKSHFVYDKITIENLLTERSGLVKDLYNVKMNSELNLDSYLTEISKTYLTDYPGEMMAYSNVGYVVLGIIIERVSKMKYLDFIRQEILVPLHINLHVVCSDEDLESLKKNYDVSESYNDNFDEVVDYKDNLNYIPSGSGVYMSIKDFMKFSQGFLNADNGVLRESTLLLMERCYVKEELDREILNYGYGLIHNDLVLRDQTIKILGNSGHTLYHHSIFNYLPNHDLAIVCLTNSLNGKRVVKRIGLLILQTYLALNDLNTNDYSLEEDHLGGDLDNYIGNYATSYGLVSIFKHHHTLYTNFNNYKIKLLPCEDGYLHCLPNSLLGQLPNVKNKLKALRIKVCDYHNEDVLVLEYTDKKFKNTSLIGSRIEINKYDSSVTTLLGNYEVEDELKEVITDVHLTMVQNVLELEYNICGTSAKLLVEQISPHHLITLGYGNSAKESIKILKDDGITLVYNGIKFKKIGK